MWMPILLGAIFGLGVGVLTARASANREPIYGGGAAKATHYITASIATGTPILVLSSLFVLENRWFVLLVALFMIVVMYASATIFATIERPARENALALKAQQGWTEEDARTSGL